MATYVRDIVSAHKPKFAQWTVTATATTVASLLDEDRTPSRLTVRNATGGANAVYFGGSQVANTPANAGGEIPAGQEHTFHYQSPVEIYLVGTANAANIVFITAEYTDRIA